MVRPPLVTALFVPADRPERFSKAQSSGADAIIIDLEDAVAPSAKATARSNLCLPGVLPTGCEVFVRVNGRQTPWYSDDLAAVARLQAAGVVLPKAESAEDVAHTSKSIPGAPLIALIETARGLAAVREISAVLGVTRLAFGSIDFCVDIGAAHGRDALLAARSAIVLASRLSELAPPLDGITTSIDDSALIEEDARYAYRLGFGGKLCVHPRQIVPVRRGFASSPEEIAWAKRILAAGTEGAIAVDGTMVDSPVRARARQILALDANNS
jgi:citrate lyase subunit beta / citryl-CoA lyase